MTDGFLYNYISLVETLQCNVSATIIHFYRHCSATSLQADGFVFAFTAISLSTR